MRRAILVTLVCLGVIVLTASFAMTEDRSKQDLPSTNRTTRFESTPLQADPTVSSLTEIAQLTSYLDAVKKAEDQKHLEEYISAVQAAEAAAAEQARLDAEAAAAEQARRSQPQQAAAPTYTGSGGCTGFVIPDYIIQRESGGNPFVQNPSSDAFGCAQTLLSHYNAGGTCAGLNPYDIQGQRDCVYRLSDGGTNLAPWALTR